MFTSSIDYVCPHLFLFKDYLQLIFSSFFVPRRRWHSFDVCLRRLKSIFERTPARVRSYKIDNKDCHSSLNVNTLCVWWFHNVQQHSWWSLGIFERKKKRRARRVTVIHDTEHTERERDQKHKLLDSVQMNHIQKMKLKLFTF